MERGFAVASVGWEASAGAIGQPLLVSPPTADAGGRALRGQVLVELRPSAPVRSLPLSQLFSRPYPAADLEEPRALLQVRDWEDGPVSELRRHTFRFARDRDGRAEPSREHLWLDGGFEPGRIYQLLYTTEGAPVVGAGLLALRDAATYLRAGGPSSPAPAGFRHVYAY